jgi:hypothetical protein
MGGGAFSWCQKKWMLIVACLSGFWLREMLLGHPRQKMFPGKTKKYGGNKWAGSPTTNGNWDILCLLVLPSFITKIESKYTIVNLDALKTLIWILIH